ncbi:MAG: hypothetical protein HYV37_02525 [Candidatus Levyibacteriota bacterium]|nr:MAG: hypothetical protein HYV37_02525 [Candidatus Levybacteria bacterium]
MKPIKVIYNIIIFGLIVIVFRNWFLWPEIIGGDWQYLFPEMLRKFSFFPLSWDPANGNGLGGISPIYSLIIYNNFTISIATYLHIPWVIVYKIFWFGLFIALSILSSTTLLKSILSNVKYWQLIIGGVIFTSNTYILMIVGGGQMGVALAYSVAPLVLAWFIKIIHNSSFIIHHSFIAGLALGAQVMFDSRIAYITMLAVGVYYVLDTKYYELAKKSIRLAIPIGIAILLHASWILPMFLFRQNPFGDLGQSYTGSGMVRFLSFAHFSDALALLHPNWPENLFGKVYFMRPEFLFLSILAYSSLLFLKKSNRTIIFFTLLGLLGSFLAKGTNEPFGEVYIWLFEHVPGFVLFRDPTKWYLMIALSYSVLIPFSLLQISRKVSSVKYLVLAAFLLFWLFLIRPAILGQLGGTFQQHEIPKEYIVLKDFLHDKSEFFRTLWIPRGIRFNYFSNNHLIVALEKLFGTRYISTETKTYLQELGIKYIIVPFDPLGEIFVTNRKYDEEQYKDTIKRLETLSWLTRLHGFGRIAVFEVPHPKDRFWLTKNGKISYTMINPVDYDLTISITEPQNLIFSENYNPSWIAQSDGFTAVSSKTSMGLNSFFFDKAGDYHIKVIFAQERYFRIGWVIASITLTIVIFAILALKHKKE